MNRRKFLIGAAQIALGGVAAAVFPRPAAAAQEAVPPKRDRVFRGTEDGRILESLDGTQTWQVNLNLGPGYRVSQIVRRGAWWYARVQFKQCEFLLKSSDGRLWHSLNWSGMPGSWQGQAF